MVHFSPFPLLLDSRFHQHTHTHTQRRSNEINSFYLNFTLLHIRIEINWANRAHISHLIHALRIQKDTQHQAQIDSIFKLIVLSTTYEFNRSIWFIYLFISTSFNLFKSVHCLTCRSLIVHCIIIRITWLLFPNRLAGWLTSIEWNALVFICLVSFSCLFIF